MLTPAPLKRKWANLPKVSQPDAAAQLSVGVRSVKRAVESLPLLLVWYPGHYGTFFAFSDKEDSKGGSTTLYPGDARAPRGTAREGVAPDAGRVTPQRGSA